MVPEITTSEFDSKISQGTCAVKFWSEFCGPCKNYANTFHEFAKNNQDVKCFSVDAINEPELSVKFKVRRVPLTIIFKNGEEYKRLEGVQTISQLEGNSK